MDICGHGSLLDLDEALARLSAALAAPGLPALSAERDDPALDRSAMDGLALRTSDGLSPRRVLGTLFTGMDPGLFRVGPGEGVRIMTGACLPEGADAIVPVELLDPEGRTPRNLPKAGDHIRRQASQARAGETILPGGQAWTAARAGLFAQEGRPLPLPRRPVVAIASTGDELVADPAPHQIRDSNGPMLEALAFRLGAEVRRMSRLPDNEEALRQALQSMHGVDLLLTSGGVSAGDKDLLPGILQGLGAEILFHKIRLKPGKPMLAARFGALTVLGLPGNPQSAYLNALLFLPLALARLQGAEAPPIWHTGHLAEAVKNKDDRPYLVPCGLEGDRLSPLPSQGSGDLGGLARARACALIPPGGLEAGPANYMFLL
jgi:molybdopterin molybdotransferase